MALAALAVIALPGAGAGQEARQPPEQAPRGPESPQIVVPPPKIAISPSRFEVAIDGAPTVHSLRLMNFGDDPVTVRVSTAAWDLDERNRVRVTPPDEQSLDQWLVVNPLRFTVPARGSQTVRFSIRPRVRPEPGEHRAMIYLEQLPEDRPEQRPQEQLVVNFRFGVAVYGHVGPVERRGELHDVSVRATAKHLVAGLDISSGGTANVRLDGQYSIWPADEFPGAEAVPRIDPEERDDATEAEPMLAVGRMPTTPVLPGFRRTLELQLAHGLTPGRYVLALVGDLGGDHLARSIPFRVPDPGERVTTGRLEQGR